MDSWLRRVATVGLLIALVSPAVRDRDGLPLSTFPMYAATRADESTFITATGIDADGAPVTLSALSISGSRDRLIAQSFLNDAVRRGDEASICRDIADRVDGSVRVVEIATERHNTIDRLRGDDSLVDRTVLADCERTSG